MQKKACRLWIFSPTRKYDTVRLSRWWYVLQDLSWVEYLVKYHVRKQKVICFTCTAVSKYKPSIQVENLRMQIYIWHMTFTHSLRITVDQWRQFWTIERRRASPIGLTSSHVVVYLWCVFAIICWRAPNPLTMSHRLSRKGGKIVDKWTRVHGRVYMHRNGLMRLHGREFMHELTTEIGFEVSFIITAFITTCIWTT